MGKMPFVYYLNWVIINRNGSQIGQFCRLAFFQDSSFDRSFLLKLIEYGLEALLHCSSTLLTKSTFTVAVILG